MKALIALNGDCPSPEFLRKLSIGRALIAADGGYRHYLSAGINPCVVVGDMDSIDDLPINTELIRYDPEKDRTDGQLAIEAAVERGAGEISLTCALSRDMGHVMENIRMMLFSPVPIRIEEPETSIFLLKEGKRMEIPEGHRVSLVPLGESADLVLKGFKYDFDGVLREKSGISNLSKESAEIRVREGILAVFLSR
jgi:thiamine pyrophosphokinase